MSGLALVLPWNAVFLFRSPLRDTSFAYRNRPAKFVANATLPKPSLNAPRQQTASDEIPIAADARPLHTIPAVSSLGGLRTPAPGVRRAAIMGPPSANLHTSGLAALL
jgi:hypothetical protein